MFLHILATPYYRNQHLCLPLVFINQFSALYLPCENILESLKQTHLIVSFRNSDSVSKYEVIPLVANVKQSRKIIQHWWSHNNGSEKFIEQTVSSP
jgi:hypothetical protein